MKTKTNGAFHQEKDKTWTIDTKVKVNDKFLHFKRTGFASLSAAKSAYETEKADFIKSKTNTSKVMFFDDLLNEYKMMRAVIVNVTTLDADKSVYNIYFLPYFKHKLLADVFNKSSINIWYHNLIDTNKYSNNKKSKVITRMKDLLKFAYLHKYITAETYQDCDVCLYQVKNSKLVQKERVVWSREEEMAFFDATRTNATDYLMFKVFFTCSPRLGEFLGLQANCFDYKKRKITIKQQVLNVDGRGAILTDKLKTHDSYRTIVVSDDLADLLEDYIITTSLKENDFIFHGSRKNIPLSRTGFRRKLYKYCELAGVRKINPHASRHLQATKLASVCHTGEEIEAAARRLGHSPEMFMNTYARHCSDKTENELLERLAEA